MSTESLSPISELRMAVSLYKWELFVKQVLTTVREVKCSKASCANPELSRTIPYAAINTNMKSSLF